MLVVAGSFALLALASAASRWSPLFAVVIGASYSVQGTIGPAFIVGAGLGRADVARQLTAFNLAYPAGQVLGAALVAIAQSAGMSTTWTFLSATFVLLAMTAVSAPFLATPAGSLAAALKTPSVTQPDGTAATAQRPTALLRSMFGVFLLVVVVTSVGNNGLTSQLANVMPHAFGFSATSTSLLLGVVGLINIPVILLTARWLTRASSVNVYAAGTALRAAGALAMALVGLMTTPVLVLAALAMLVTYQGVPIPRIAASDLAVQISPTGPAQADGYYFAASALGSVFGCLLAGVLANGVDYNAVNWMAALAGVDAAIARWPLLRHRSASWTATATVQP